MWWWVKGYYLESKWWCSRYCILFIWCHPCAWEGRWLVVIIGRDEMGDVIPPLACGDFWCLALRDRQGCVFARKCNWIIASIRCYYHYAPCTFFGLPTTRTRDQRPYEALLRGAQFPLRYVLRFVFWCCHFCLCSHFGYCLLHPWLCGCVEFLCHVVLHPRLRHCVVIFSWLRFWAPNIDRLTKYRT